LGIEQHEGDAERVKLRPCLPISYSFQLGKREYNNGTRMGCNSVVQQHSGTVHVRKWVTLPLKGLNDIIPEKHKVKCLE
jgi:hypothetical protein